MPTACGETCQHGPDLFEISLVDDNGPGHEIAEALALAVEKHAGNSNGVERGKLVHEPKQIAAHGFNRSDGPAVILDDPDCAPDVFRESGRSIVTQKQTKYP